MALVAQKVICPSQTAFLPGRNIMKGVVVLHETLHELYRKKMSGAIFKFDFEKGLWQGQLDISTSDPSNERFFPKMVYLDPIFCKRW